MNYGFTEVFFIVDKYMKVTPNLFLRITSLLVLFTSQMAFAQTPIPEKIEDGNWAYKSSDNQILVDNLQKTEPFRNGVGIARKDGKLGAYNSEMKLILPFDFETLEVFSDQILKATKNDIYQLFSLDGKAVGPKSISEIERVRSTSDTMVVANKNSKHGVLKPNGDVLVPLVYSGVPALISSNHLLVHRKKGKSFVAGIIDLNNTVIVPFKYSFIQKWGNLYRCQIPKNNTLHYYDFDGKLVYSNTKGKNDLIRRDAETLISQAENGQELTFQNSGEKLMATRWLGKDGYYYGTWQDTTVFMRANGFKVKKSGNWQFNSVKAGYLCIQNPSTKEFLILDEDGKKVYLGKDGRPITWTRRWLTCQIPARGSNLILIDLAIGEKALSDTFDIIEITECDYVKVTKNTNTKLYNAQLQESSKGALSNSEDQYLLLPMETMVNINQRYLTLTSRSLKEDMESETDCDAKIITLEGTTEISLIYNEYNQNPLKNRLLITQRYNNRSKNGIIDFGGKVIVPIEYEGVRLHYDGLIAYRVLDSLDHGVQSVYGVMNANGVVVITPEYSEINQIKNGILYAKKHGLMYLIDVKSKKTILGGYNSIRADLNGYYHFNHQGLSGIADPDGNILIHPKYQEITSIQEEGGLYKVKHLKKEFYIDLKGNEYPIE